MATETTELSQTPTEKWTTPKILGLFSTLVILLIPTVGNTFTQSNHPITEHSFFWPWLILLRYIPSESIFNADEYNFVTVPWTLLIFIPFLYALYHSYKLFFYDDQHVQRASYIALAAMIQIIVIWLTFQSQYPDLPERIRIQFYPELILMVVNGYFAGKWYLEETQEALERSKEKRLAKEQMQKESEKEAP